ncbi:hypothetical protein [Arenimonas caeni]|jgi:hypothetical protein|uniref:hypothetical protein n=1 Tax=Arenimonas caeni TaxID=2058085 RepID=UPI0013B04BF9|nr:hypothetical protein [Arenimonas caeni]MDY0020894.1 hypothetical protein [Arenimonas caeni]
MKLDFRTANKPGLLLGAALFIAGVLAISVPPEIVVHHGNSRPGVFRGLKTAEVVTRDRARFYGGCLAAAGVFLTLFSLYVPRRPPSVDHGGPN